MKIYFGFCIFFLSIFDKINGLLPPNIVVCHRSDPKISDCIIRNIINISPRFGSGDLGGGFIVPPLEPFYIKEVKFGEERGLKIQIKDLNIRGASKFIIEKLRTNINELKFDALIRLPLIDIYGKYNLLFDILGARSKSDGDFYGQLRGTKIRLTFRGRKYIRNNVEYLKFDPVLVKFSRGDVTKLKLTNLFGGNKLLGEIVTSLLISDQDFLIKTITPSLEPTLSSHFTGIANNIVQYASFNELLPL